MRLHGRSPARLAAEYGVLIALALVLSYAESLIPAFFAVPGVKLGLANTVAVFALYRMRGCGAWVISLVRVMLASILFGSMFTFAYSAAGAALSLAVMQLVKKTGRFNPVGVSVCGGVAHNAGQILVAVFLLETGSLIYYLPVLCISGVIAGIAIGAVSGMLIRRIGWGKDGRPR